MFALRRPSPEALARVLADLDGAALTYPEAGATEPAATDSAAPLPSGYHHVRRSRVVGHGEPDWAAAAAGIRGWQMHRGQGFLVVPDDPPITAGTAVASAIRLPGPGVHVVMACRIVWVVDEPDRFGFAYGTLPVHPESGEEAFVAHRDAAGAVTLTVTAFSRPRHPLVRLGGPIARRQQDRATDGYLDALQAHVASA
jgi:uncharacterized protein (UPF0548 family)